MIESSEQIKPKVNLNDAVVEIIGNPKEFLTEDADRIVETARKRFNEGYTRDLKFRRSQLIGVRNFLKENQDQIVEALQNDFKKPAEETHIFEIGSVLIEIDHQLDALKKLGKPQKVAKRAAQFFDEALIYREPYGVVLVMSAWNYPFMLLFAPAVGAIAAGNAVVLKPSDLAPHSANLIYDKLPKYINKELYPVFLGGIKETTTLLEKKFDYIFYTGSTEVGKIIHRAANKYLTPITLELGGKSPVYIDETADIALAAKRILWGKCLNSGQTCIAPDYILCTKEVQEQFVDCAEAVLGEFYSTKCKESPHYARMVSDRHFERVAKLLDGLKIALGGRVDAKERFIEPTIAINVHPEHPVMKGEIFGPILPIVNISSVSEAIQFINDREKPLVLYIFSRNKKHVEQILRGTSSGGACVNETIFHAAVETLPFGGVGYSGMGAYHGEQSFNLFSHNKSVLKKDFSEISELFLEFRYPPYSDNKIWLFYNLMNMNYPIPTTFLKYLAIFLIIGCITFAGYYIHSNF